MVMTDEQVEVIFKRLLRENMKDIVSEVSKQVVTDHMKTIAKMASEETAILLTEHAYARFGKVMFNKLLQVLGVAIIGLTMWLYGEGYLKWP